MLRTVDPKCFSRNGFGPGQRRICRREDASRASLAPAIDRFANGSIRALGQASVTLVSSRRGSPVGLEIVRERMLCVEINGESRRVSPGTTLSALLEELGLALSSGIAVEVNREIIPRSAHEATVLQADDRVEIVTFVGGG